MSGEHHRRVLVADDDAAIRRLIASALRQRDLIVDEAVSGRQALTLMAQHSYSVLLLDLLMPDQDGFTVLTHLNENPPRPFPIVLVVTGAPRAVVEDLDAQTIHGIVRKPFDVEELSSLVVACSEIRGRGFGAMAFAVVSGAPLLEWLKRFAP